MATEIYKPLTWDTVSATLDACPADVKANALQYISNCASTYGTDAQDVAMYMKQIVAELDFGNPSKDMKIGVLSALKASGPEATGTYLHPYIERLLSDQEAQVRYEACTTVTAAGPFAQSAAPSVARLLDDSSDMVRCGACSALAALKLQGFDNQVAKLVDSGSPEVQGAACLALAQMGGAALKAQDLVKKLAEPRSRLHAVRSLGLLGSAAVNQMDTVLDLLRDESDDVREAAAAASGAIWQSSPSRPQLGKVSSALSHQDGRFRIAACTTLTSMGADAVLQCKEELQALLEDDFEMPACTALTLGGARTPQPPTARKLRCAAAAALGTLGSACPRETAELVRRLLEQDDWETKACGCDALAAMREAAQSQSGFIVDVLMDDAAPVRAKAAAAIAAVGDTSFASNVATLLSDKVPTVRAAALRALGDMSERGEEYADKVFERLADSSVSVRVAAVEALAAMPRRGQFYAGMLAQRLKAEDEAPAVVAAAASGLGRMAERGAAYAEDVAFCLDSPHASVRSAAATSLGQMGEDARPYLAKLQQLQQDVQDSVRIAALDAVQLLSGSGMASLGNSAFYNVPDGE
mmetsp:Transcript_27330/g.63722  ORF Transcript_27330/g.63722 Transcript_27330/m.63722 type:complete len:583 (+) Transcript_27330:110-1858(+)